MAPSIKETSAQPEWSHQSGPTRLNETHSRSFLINLRNFVIEPENDERMKTRNDVVAGQDGEILEYMNPLITPPSNTKELFVPADKLIARYREILKGYEANGWKIDMDKLSLGRQRVAYAIPSPSRRESKGWVIDPVPLVEPSESGAVQAVAE